jgi:hypothetical protein
MNIEAHYESNSLEPSKCSKWWGVGYSCEYYCGIDTEAPLLYFNYMSAEGCNDGWLNFGRKKCCCTNYKLPEIGSL